MPWIQPLQGVPSNNEGLALVDKWSASFPVLQCPFLQFTTVIFFLALFLQCVDIPTVFIHTLLYALNTYVSY